MTTTPPDTDTRTADERLTALRAEAAQLELGDLDDPLRAAADVAAWHTRNDQRRRRRVEIENEVRDLERWGLLAVTHPKSVSALTRAKPHAPAWDYVTRHGTWGEALRRPATPNPRQIIDGWLVALQKFARDVGADDTARRIVTRELDEWFHTRNAVMRAELQEFGVTIPGPEFKSREGLPPYLRLGVYRTDGGGGA